MQERQHITVNVDKFEGLYKVKAVKTSKSYRSWAISSVTPLKDFNDLTGMKFIIGEKNDDISRLYHDVAHMTCRTDKVIATLQSKQCELRWAFIIKKDTEPSSSWSRWIKTYLRIHTHIFDTNDEIFVFQLPGGLWW